MQAVHARFTGQKGTFAHFGDSITVTMAFWAPLPYARKNAPAEMERAFRLVNAYLRPECWRQWKGPKYGNEGGRTVRWAYEHLGEWLHRLNPEVALIMFGTNDLNRLGLDEYGAKMRAIVQKCLDNGTVVLLSTIPPRSGFVEKAAAFAQAVRELARELKVPLIDFHAEILRRRPNDWDGSQRKFEGWQGYDVPTLIARDGVHPSHPKQYRNDYSEEALNCCGYSLRNYLVLMKYAQVVEKVLRPRSNAEPSAGAKPQPRTVGLRPPEQPWFPQAPPLPPPKGEVIRVASVEELFAAVERVKPGGTILLADGHYPFSLHYSPYTGGFGLRHSHPDESVGLCVGDQHPYVMGGQAPGPPVGDRFHEHLHPASHKLLVEGQGQFVAQGVQGTATPLLFGGGDLVGQGGGFGAGTRGVLENVHPGEAHPAAEVVGVLELLLRFAGEPDQNVGGEGQVGHESPRLLHNFREPRRPVAPPHPPEHFLVAAL